MLAISRAFRTDTKLPTWLRVALNLAPFILIAISYVAFAILIRYQDAHGIPTANPRCVPLPGDIWQAFLNSITPNSGGQIMLLDDLSATGQRFGIGLFISALLGGPLGIYIGLFPTFTAFGKPIGDWLSKIQPLLLLPILFIFFGIGEESKIALIVLGVLPGYILEVARMTKQIRVEQIHKAQTLGASESEIAWSIVFPQIFPSMLASIRANLSIAFGLVIAAESNAASAGLGYRIFLVRRFMDMSTILEYVMLAMLIMFAADLLFQTWEHRYRWNNK